MGLLKSEKVGHPVAICVSPGPKGRRTTSATHQTTRLLLVRRTTILVQTSLGRSYCIRNMRCLPLRRYLPHASIVLAVNNSNAVLRRTGFALRCRGPVLNVGVKHYNFLTAYRMSRVRRGLTTLIQKRCLLSDQVLLCIQILNRSN